MQLKGFSFVSMVKTRSDGRVERMLLASGMHKIFTSTRGSEYDMILKMAIELNAACLSLTNAACILWCVLVFMLEQGRTLCVRAIVAINVTYVFFDVVPDALCVQRSVRRYRTVTFSLFIFG